MQISWLTVITILLFSIFTLSDASDGRPKISLKQGHQKAENNNICGHEYISNKMKISEQKTTTHPKKTQTRKLDSLPNFTQGSTPQPIRITIEYQLDNIESKYQQVIKDGVDVAMKYFRDVIQVLPEEQPIVMKDYVKIYGDEIHLDSVNGEQGYCKWGIENYMDFVEITKEIESDGIENSDLHIIVTCQDEEEETWLAYAVACQWRNNRPIMGLVNYNLNYFKQYYTIGDGADFEYHLETTIHEVLHILGFLGDSIKDFRDSNGEKYSEQKQKEHMFMKEIRGLDTLHVATPLMLKYSKEYFGCDTAEGVQFENQGEQGSQGHHLERTTFYNEMMNPSGIQSDSVTSIFTLALLKDSNFYADVDLTFAEDMQWGIGRGCNFLTSCSTSFPEFVPNKEVGCSFHHFGIGFGNGWDPLLDTKCNVRFFDYNSGIDCTEPDHLTDSDKTFEKNGPTSKCFESSFVKDGDTIDNQKRGDHRCYENRCEDGKVIITITKDGEDYEVECTSDGAEMDPPNNSGITGKITCPRDIEEYCTFPVPCEDYCSDKGYCLRQGGQSKCHCLDEYAGSNCSVKCDTFVNNSGSCVDSCEDDQYAEFGTRICKDCHDSCSDYCSGPSSDECQDCPQGQFSKDGKCVEDCGKNYYAKKLGGTCEQCSSDCVNGCIREADNCIVISAKYTYIYEEEQYQYAIGSDDDDDDDDEEKINDDKEEKDNDDEEKINDDKEEKDKVEAQNISFKLAILLVFFIITI